MLETLNYEFYQITFESFNCDANNVQIMFMFQQFFEIRPNNTQMFKHTTNSVNLLINGLLVPGSLQTSFWAVSEIYSEYLGDCRKGNSVI